MLIDIYSEPSDQITLKRYLTRDHQREWESTRENQGEPKKTKENQLNQIEAYKNPRENQRKNQRYIFQNESKQKNTQSRGSHSLLSQAVQSGM